MNNRSIIFYIFFFIFPSIAWATDFVAYSLLEAQNYCNKSPKRNKELIELGGITHLSGLIFDQQNKDWIIVGQAVDGFPPITLDDFVVVLRSVFLHQKFPLVSIDNSPDTLMTKKQVVRFEGGIENTKVGKDMIDADILLKRIALEKIKAEIWGVQSYVSLRSGQISQLIADGDQLSSRFWFKNVRPSLAVREDVYALMDLSLGIDTEVLYVAKNGNRQNDNDNYRDEAGEMFAHQLMMNIEDLSNAFPVLRRTLPILALVSLADALNKNQVHDDLSYWLYDYEINRVETPTDFDLITVKKIIQDKKLINTISGGLELNPIIVRLKKGYPTTFKDVVLKSRPTLQTLTWFPPLQGWQTPGLKDIDVGQQFYNKNQQNGFSIQSSMMRSDIRNSFRNQEHLTYKLPPLHASLPMQNFHDKMPESIYSKIGGVMLSGVASMAGNGPAEVDLSSGNFSFIVDGKNARLAPGTFRKFITALWTVYYSNQDPGISIDPIAPGVDKHLVRYIGKVINTDLGRVMREADYLMKKWSVGTERPEIPAFKNPDEYAAEKRILYLAASRFWFVPEDMRFKRSDDLLLFDDGRMTIQTEYLTNSSQKQADPANEKFAEFFTAHYPEISEKYPVYTELFEYAKMVSLAKYLKEQGIPLFWFLMANKDLVITEDSPGTVDELVKGSDFFRDVTISGGVDLGFDPNNQSNYVYDQAAVDAINKAIAKNGSDRAPDTTIVSDRKIVKTALDPFSFNLGKESYTVVPQHSLTSGKDRRGIRYQTDIALRGRGLQLSQQSLDILKAELIYRETMEEMEPVLKTMEENKLGQEEIYALYQAKKNKATKRIEGILSGLEKIKNKKYSDKDAFIRVLEESIGPETTERLKPLIAKVAYYNTNLELVRYFNSKDQSSGEFGNGWNLLVPYKIKPSGTTRKEFQSLMIPEEMALVNLLSGEEEVLTFSTDRYTVAGYVPEKLQKSQVVGLFMMTDGSYRLADKLGNEFWFNSLGYLTDMVFSQDHHIRYEYLDGFTDAFEQNPYSIEPHDETRVSFLNVTLPKRMELKDHIHGAREIFTFSDKGDFAGYVPDDAEKSHFKIMAMLSDASFRLIDKNGNETALTASGKFDKMAVAEENPLVSAISQGSQKIVFKYTIGNTGQVLIASANLSEDGNTDVPNLVVKYEYDAEGRLADIKKIDNRTARDQQIDRRGKTKLAGNW